MFVKIVIEKPQGEDRSVSDRQGRSTESAVLYETHLYQTEEVVWKKCPAEISVPKMGSEWQRISLYPDNNPLATEFLSILMEVRHLQVIVYCADLYIMNDQGKTIDHVKAA